MTPPFITPAEIAELRLKCAERACKDAQEQHNAWGDSIDVRGDTPDEWRESLQHIITSYERDHRAVAVAEAWLAQEQAGDAGTVKARWEWLMAALEVRFPMALNDRLISGVGAEQVYIDAIDRRILLGAVGVSSAVDSEGSSSDEPTGAAPVPVPDSPTATRPSEAIYAFAAWLTTRTQSLVCGGTANCALVVAAVSAFCESQHYERPRENYTDFLSPYPQEQGLASAHANSESITETCDVSVSPSPVFDSFKVKVVPIEIPPPPSDFSSPAPREWWINSHPDRESSFCLTEAEAAYTRFQGGTTIHVREVVAGDIDWRARAEDWKGLAQGFLREGDAARAELAALMARIAAGPRGYIDNDIWWSRVKSEDCNATLLLDEVGGDA